jgi:hypothetical protein
VADIFQEVDDEVRQERLNRLWKRYAPVLIGAAVLIVVATGAVTFWRHHVESQRMEASDALIAAMTQAGKGDRPGAIKALDELAQSARDPYDMIARLRAAELRAESGDHKGAADSYAEVARTATDKDIQELAQVMQAVQQLAATPADAAALGRLKALAEAGGPWHNVAREYLAYTLFQQGDVAQARQVWTQITQDAEASAALKSRATQLLDATAGNGGAAPKAPATPAPAAAPAPAPSAAPSPTPAPAPAATPAPAPAAPAPSSQPDTKGK